MRLRVLALFAALCLTASAQTLTVDKLSTALKNIAANSAHPATDAELAKFLAGVRLTEKLDDTAMNSLLVECHLGAKASAALHKLHDQSASLPVARPAPPPEALHPIRVPGAEEQAAILDDVRKYALNYSQTLPDFICTERELRYGAPPVMAGSPDWRQLDELVKRLTYFQQKEAYELRMHNNTIATNQDVKSAGGSQSFGDFGSMMRQVFEPETSAHFEWQAWQTLRGQRVMAFQYRVVLDRSRYHLIYDRGNDIVTAYHGWFDVTEDTHEVVRIAVIAENIPADFPIQSASDILDYDSQDLSGQRFLLPSRAEILMKTGKYLTRNLKDFTSYRKYSADAVITYDSDTAPIKH